DHGVRRLGQRDDRRDRLARVPRPALGGGAQSLRLAAADDAARLGPGDDVAVGGEVLLGVGAAVADGVGEVDGELAAAEVPDVAGLGTCNHQLSLDRLPVMSSTLQPAI